MSEDFLSNLGHIIDQVSKEKGVKKDFVVNSILQGVLTAVRRKYGTYRDIEAKYNEETGEVELFEFKKVVPDKEFEDELIEIKYTEAQVLDPEVQLEDQIGTRLEMKALGRIDAQVVKQIIMQNLREAEHEIIFNEFEKRKGEIASGTVRRADDYTIVVELDKTEAYIPRREQIPDETYKSGDRIQGYILEVRQTVKGPQIIMSRAHPKYLIKLFEAEVPEVYEGIVKIVDAAREPGQRAKMAVYSTDPAVHPVGACVGVKGSRVQNITQELKGERIDIIIWEENPVQYVCNALAPAKIVRVLLDEDNKQMQIIVPDDQLSLAIGKKGQNVRLAVKLTQWNLDLVSESQAGEKKRQALFNLCLLPDVNETMAESIYQYGFSSFQEIATAVPKDIQDIPGYEKEEEAVKLIKASGDLLEKYKREGTDVPTLPEAKKVPIQTGADLKEKAEEILKKELAQLSGDSKQPKEVESKSPEAESVQKEEIEQVISKPEPAKKAEVKEVTSETESAQEKTVKETDSQKESSQKKEVKEVISNAESAREEEVAEATTKSEPAQEEEVAEATTKSEPAQEEAVKAEAAASTRKAAKAESVKKTAQKAKPAKAKPVKKTAQKAKPAKAKPVKAKRSSQKKSTKSSQKKQSGSKKTSPEN